MKNSLVALAVSSVICALHAGETGVTVSPNEPPTTLEKAEEILSLSDHTILTTDKAEEAGLLLSHDDLFVQASAEWALSLKVGNENMLDQAKWPAAKNPEWFVKWRNIPLSKRVEMDWCRQAIAAGVSRSPEKLIAQIESMAKRVRIQLQNDAFNSTAEVAAKKGVKNLDALAREAKTLKTKQEVRNQWLAARRILRPLVFHNKALDFDSLVFYTRYAPHHKANVCGILHNGTYKPGGDITIIRGLESVKEVRKIIGEQLPQGHLHGMDLHFDGEKLVFGYGKQLTWPPKREAHYPQRANANWALHLRQDLEGVGLYEINTDGTGLRRLTSHPVWSDTEPVYCPNDDVAFTSERSSHSPPCDSENNDISDTNLYLYQRDDGNLKRLTNHRDVDMTPRLLNNGLLAYLHWEYQERHFNENHSIWTIRPDGTNADAYYKSHIPYPWALREVRSIPNTNKIVAIAAGHHCYSRGPIVVIDPDQGGNNPAAMSLMTLGVKPQEGKMHESAGPLKFGGVQDQRGYYRNPYPLSETVMLSSYTYASNYCKRHATSKTPAVPANGFGIYLIDAFGNKELIFRDPLLCSVDVAPLKKRHRPHILPTSNTSAKNHATCIIPNIYEGMAENIEPGTIKHLRISQHLPTPLDANGRARKFAYGNKWGELPGATRWTSVREIGVVSVERDGSAHFKVPTADNASVYFQALDKNFMEVKRMRSSVSFQPGEVRSCTGCHETRSHSAPSYQQGIAINSPPAMPKQAPWGYDAFDYESHVQPILDRHCVSCHSGKDKETPLDFSDKKVASGNQGLFNQSYHTILGPTLLGIGEKSLVTLANRFSDSSVTKAMAFGSHASKFISTLKKGHKEVTLSADEWYALVTWVDFNCVYHGKLINKNPSDGSLARREKFDWPNPWQVTKTPALSGYSARPTPKEEPTLVVTDHQQGKILRYSNKGKITWSYDAKNAQDIQVLESGDMLFADGDTVKEINRKGTVLFKYQGTGPILSCERLDNGFTLIADSGTSCLMVLDRKMKPLKTIPLPINSKGLLRARRGPRGTYFVTQSSDQLVCEYDENGTRLRSITTPDAVHSVIAMNNGDVVIGGDNGVRIVDPQGKVTWSLTSKDLPDVNFKNVSRVELLANGNFILTDPLLEINRNKRIVTRFSYADNTSSPSSATLTGLSTQQSSEGDYMVVLPDAIKKLSSNGSVLQQFNIGSCSDMQWLPNGNILYSSGKITKELNQSGEITTSFESDGNILSSCRLSNGQTVLLDGSNARLILLDATMKKVRTIPLKDVAQPVETGLVRESKHGVMVATGDDPVIREYDLHGEMLVFIHCEGPISAMALDYAGDVTVGGRFGLRRYSAGGTLIWSLSIEDIPELGQIDIRSLQIRDNSNMILVNRLTNPEHGLSLLEITQKKEIVRRFPPVKGARQLQAAP